jgi:hypothetical protein
VESHPPLSPSGVNIADISLPQTPPLDNPYRSNTPRDSHRSRFGSPQRRTFLSPRTLGPTTVNRSQVRRNQRAAAASYNQPAHKVSKTYHLLINGACLYVCAGPF